MIVNNLAGFYRKTETAFLGEQIDFALMTPAQLDQALEESIVLFNQLYPPPPKSKFQKFMNTGIKIGIVAGTVAVAGGAVLASYGISAPQAMATISPTLKATAAKGSMLANVQKGAALAGKAGLIYGKVTGDTPEDLVKAAELIKSPTALDAMEFVAKEQLDDMGQTVQAENTAANDALRARLKQEQDALADAMMQAAADKSASQGRPTPQPAKATQPRMLEIVAIATPFILYMLR